MKSDVLIRFDPAVNALLDANGHPLRQEIDALRRIILAADPRIEEGVKWNAASFRTTDWFATLNGPRHTKEAMVVLHAGAKAKDMDLGTRISDPDRLIQWLGAERGMITFASLEEIRTVELELIGVIQQWIALVDRN